MHTAYLAVAVVTIAANMFSGVAAIARLRPIMNTLGPAMERTGVPQSWLIFPIGVLKAAGAAGLLLGILGVPLIGTAAAAGLVLYFVCAAYTHIRVSDWAPQFFLGVCFFLPLAIASLALSMAQ